MKIGDLVRIKSTGEVMELDNIFDDGDVLVGMWDCGSRMVEVVNANDIEVVKIEVVK